LQDRAPWVPPELAEITHRAISRDTSKRFRNAGELRDALAHIVPDGSRLTPEMLRPVAAEHRAFVAPRLTLSDDGMLRATTRSGLTANAATVGVAPKRSNTGLFVGLAVTLAIVAAGSIVGYRMFASSASHAALSASEPLPPSPVAPEPRPAPLPAAPVLKRFTLSVVPAEAEVAIDGTKVPVNAGQVDVEGLVGATRNVKLSFKGQQQDFVVAIADSGVVPPKLDLAVKPEPAKPSGGRPAAPAPARPAAASPASTPKPDTRAAVRTDTGLNRNVDEFGK
jgi:hypothetical protein